MEEEELLSIGQSLCDVHKIELHVTVLSSWYIYDLG